MHGPISKYDLALQIERLAQRLRDAIAPTGTPRPVIPPSSDPPAPIPPDAPPNTFPDTASAFHALVEGIREGAAILAHDHTVLTCNRRLAEMLQVDCERIMGRSLYEFIPPEEHSRLRSLLKAAPQEFQKLHLRLSGNNAFPVPVEIALRTLDVGGTPVYAFLATDLRRRRRAEEQLAFQARLLENVSDAVLAMDEHYRITYWNTAAERLYGWTADEVMGRTLSEVVQPQLTAGEQRELDARLAETGAYDNESWQRRKDGALILVESRRIVLRDPQARMTGYVAIHRDITDRARAQELARRHASEIQAHAREMARYAEQMKEFAVERQNRAAIMEQRVTERTAELQAANRELEEENAKRQAEIRAREQTEAKLRDVLQSLEDTMLAARESEQLLRIAIEAAGMAAWTYDPAKDQVVTIARTEHWAQIIPEESAPLLGRGLEYVHPDDRARVTQVLPRVLAGGLFDVELRLRLPDGAVRWIVTQGRLMTEASGQGPLLVGVTQDITAARQAEERLQQLNRELEQRTREVEAERARWQGVVEGIADEVWIADREGRISLINLPDVTAMGLDAFSGKTIAEVYDEVDILNLDGQMRPFDQAPLLRALQGRIVRGEEIMRHRKTGNVRYRQYSAAPTRDATGAITGSVAIVRDITDRKHAEDAVTASEARYRNLVDLSPSGIAIHVQGKIVFANTSAARLVGAGDPADLLGRPILDFVHPDFREIALARIRASAEEGKAEPWLEEKFLRLDGKAIDVEVASVPTLFEGQPATQVVVRDITERKQATEVITALNADLERRATELEMANRELESFSYSVSHDLRTPLASISGFSNMLEEEYGSRLDPAARSYVALVQSNARQMEQLITSLLELSRLSRQTFRKQTVNMTALVREALETLHQVVQRPDLAILVQDMPDAAADPVLLKQVWVNLIANAVKFTRNCQDARIEIGCQACDGEDRVYYVRDNGVGFDMQRAEKLFGVFQRLHGEEEYEGTGIGLAIVERIVRRHGGRVWADGEVDHGATFYFTLA